MDYYTFEIDGKKCGYMECEDKDGVYYTNAFIEMDGEKFENPFWIRCKDDSVIEFKFGDTPIWKQISNYPKNTFPTSALEILVRRLKDGDVLKYNMISEGDDKIQNDIILTRIGNKIQESDNGGNNLRYVIINDKGAVIEYGWGGTAKSIIVSGRDEAIKNTKFK